MIILHGFPRVSGLVYHPTGHGRVVDQIHDISFARLDSGLAYSVHQLNIHELPTSFILRRQSLPAYIYHFYTTDP